MSFRSNFRVIYGVIIIVLLSTTLFMSLSPNMLPNVVLGSPGWLPGWLIRKSHVINGASGAGTNYQVQITVHCGSGTDSGRDMYCNSHCRTDFGDIRFTASDGTTLLNYWMQSSAASDNATFWVQVAADLGSSETIYVYYGNSAATTTSNGTSTFLLFEQSPSPAYQWVDDSANNPVLTLSAGQWDAGTLYSNCEIYVNGTYFLYYGAAATSNYWIGSQIGVATSSDAVHWTKYSGNPIIRQTGSGWKNSIVNPAVCYVNNTFYMIYTGIMSNYTSGACLATSTSGLDFTDYSSNPVLDDNSAWLSRYIETCGGGLSYFDGYFYQYYCKQYMSMSMRCTGVARSTNCINWTTCPQNPVLTTSEAGYGTGSGAAVICGSVVKLGTQYLYLFCGGTAVNSPSALNLDAVMSPTPWFNSSREWSPSQNLFKPSSGIDCIAAVKTLDANGNTIAYQNNLTITYTNGVNAYHAFWVVGGTIGWIPFADSFGNGNGWQRNGPGTWLENNGVIENNGNTVNDVYLYSNLNTTNFRVGATLSAPSGDYYNAYLVARASGMGSSTSCYAINFRAYNPGGGYGPDVRIFKDVNSLGWTGGGEKVIGGPNSATLPNGVNVEFDVYGTTAVTLVGYVNGVQKISITDSSSPLSAPGLFGLQAWEQKAAGGVSDYGNIYVAKFVSPEPSQGPWGSEEAYLYSLIVSTVGNGSVTLNNTGLYNYGDVVMLTAVPAEGWSFSNWSGNLTGSTNPATLAITGRMAVTATFAFTPGLGWLDSWQYRRIHSINGVATALTDYQISITLHYGSGTDLAGDVYLNSHCRLDFGDVRFTTVGGTTLLNYWFETVVSGSQATAWIKISSIPASPGTTSIYVYYGNPTATNVSNGKSTFIDFYGDGEGWTGWTGGGQVSSAPIPTGFAGTTYAILNSTVYFPISQGASGSWDNYLHTFQPVHKTNITEVDMDGYKFWAYYCDIYGYGIGLARSNDLIHWDKYAGNPLPGLYDPSNTYYRWPSVTFEDGVFNMFLDDYPLYDGYLNLIKWYKSTDGINFSYYETVYSAPGSNYEVECPYIWFNPNDNNYYLYFAEKNQTRTQVSMTECLRATTLDGLNASVLIDVKPNNNDEYSPSVLYDPSTSLYWLANEQGQNWNERVFYSTSPISGFVEASNSPILTDLDACGMQFWYNNKVYFYYNHQLSGSWAGPWDTRLQIQADPGISPDAGSYQMVDQNNTYATPLEGQFSTFTANFTLEYETKNVWYAGKQLVDYIGVSAAVHFGTCLGRDPSDPRSSWYYHNVPHSLSWTQLTTTLVQSQWYRIERTLDFTNHKEFVYINGVYQGYFPWVEWDGPVNSIAHAWFAFGEAETGTMWVDAFRTRQYAFSEPSQGSWGSEEQNQYSLTLNVAGAGSVGKSPDQASYLSGTVVTLTAYASVGWSFVGWSGDASGSTSPTTVTMNANKAITATFTQNSYTLTFAVSPVGSGIVNLDNYGPYHYGDIVELTAVPAAGWSFDHWSGDLTGSSNPAALTIIGNMAVTVNFILPQLYVDPSSVQKDPSDTYATFQTSVMVNKISDLKGFEFNLTWNNDIIALANVEFNTALDNVWGHGDWYVAYNVTGAGYYDLVAVTTSTSFTSTTAASLATLTFIVKAAVGQTPIHFAVVKLSDSQADSIETQVTDGIYQISGPQYLPALRMTPGTVTCRNYGEIFNVQVNVTNAITLTRFDFTIYYSPTLMSYVSVLWGELGSGTITSVDPVNGVLEGYVAGVAISGDCWLFNVTFQDTATLIWRKGQVNELDGQVWFHSVSLTFSGVQQLVYQEGGQSQINVNSVAFAFVPIQGDVNGDGIVSVTDLRIVAAYFDVKKGDPLWSVASAYDLSGNDVIDIYDLVLIAANIS